MCILSCYNQKKFYALFFGAQMSIGGALPPFRACIRADTLLCAARGDPFGKNL